MLIKIPLILLHPRHRNWGLLKLVRYLLFFHWSVFLRVVFYGMFRWWVQRLLSSLPWSKKKKTKKKKKQDEGSQIRQIFKDLLEEDKSNVRPSESNSLLNYVTMSNHSCSFRKPGFLICSLLFLLFYTNDSFTHHSISTLCRKHNNVHSKRTQLHCTVVSSIRPWSLIWRFMSMYEVISVFNQQVAWNNLIHKQEMVPIKFVFALLEKLIKE